MVWCNQHSANLLESDLRSNVESSVDSTSIRIMDSEPAVCADRNVSKCAL